MRALIGALALLLVVLTTAPGSAAPNLAGSASAAPKLAAQPWREKVLIADQSFRGLDAVSERIAWVVGTSLTGKSGGIFRTRNGGENWGNVTPEGTEGLGFRDIEASSARTAVALSVGNGRLSRIYRTTNGGKTWRETFRNKTPEAFFNCLAFYPGHRVGLAVSDPVDGKFRIIKTTDGGKSWRVLPTKGMPLATGEANFSASGDCLTITGKHAWFGTGGSKARIFHSADQGRTWRTSPSRLAAGEAAGVFALAFRTTKLGVAVGGNFEAPDNGTDAAARTWTRRTWVGGKDLPHLGEDVAWITDRALVAVGQGGDVGGTAISRDRGRTWRPLNTAPFHTLDCVKKTCFAAGGAGRVGVLKVR